MSWAYSKCQFFNLLNDFLVSVRTLSTFLMIATFSLESVPDLEKAMYLNIDGYPCVRLLNISGEIGCSNPGRMKVSAPIVKWESADNQVSQPSTFLIAEMKCRTSFSGMILISMVNSRCVHVLVSSDQSFAVKVAAVLVESKDIFKSSAFSPVGMFPQSEFAPYKSPNYKWNPTGSGIMWNRYNFPVFLLSKNSTLTVQEIVSQHGESNKAKPIDVAEFDLVMQTTKVGTHDSESCLTENSCLPLGGYSVWSSLPPVNTSAGPSKPLIFVMASQDSASFFRDKSVGADFPLSGMISLLAAVDALSRIDGLSKLKKQLVFLVFTGEAWGYLGSRRFLLELEMGADATKGLNNGSVGKGTSEGVTTLFAHAEMVTSGSKEILTALQQASASLSSENIKVNASSTSNPGVPPSSLMSFLSKNSSTPGVVLEDFDAAFSNRFYHSHLDNPRNINASSVEAAAVLVARAAYILAHGEMQPSPTLLNSIKVNASLVEELVGCLLSCDPGLSCDLVKKLISPGAVCPNHYVGVFLNQPSDTQSLANVDDTSRFVWNFLADKTSTSKGSNGRSTCPEGRCSAEDEVCVGMEADGEGRCVVSSTRYVPAYSPRLKFEHGSWRITGGHAADPMGHVDPVWTESYWNTISVRIYKVQSSAFDNLVLLGGITLTLLAYVTVVCTKAFLMKTLKHD
ncbi:unnamed protein product [Spirodela intermedia]|uniref:Nicastrin n=1 Tax=Spirodela intermedia TaxID=51605 RepID=A0A7I8J3U1_SPIIN|nr:unnamed protein product [Spirodela intermedia]CAA6664769.1 unnamed protein product [Spirodela intermedia]